MAGLRGYRPSLFTKKRHANPPDKRVQWTDDDLALERSAGVEFGRLVERYRAGDVVDVGNGYKARFVHLFSIEEAEFFANMGFAIPMDLWPHEWWWDGNYLRYGEEMLGDEF